MRATTTSAVILQYHHISNTTPAATSVTTERFAEHLAYIDAHFTVLPLDELMNLLQQGKALPENSVAITFDDGYLNILEQGHPLLTKHGFPYTIFVNPAYVGARKNLLTWQQLKQMSKEGALIANHYLAHEHLLYQAEFKDDSDWLEDHRMNIHLAEEIIVDQIGHSPRFIAYPYGEYDSRLQDLLKQMNIAGFAQHSGAISANSDLTAIPRYPASGVYSNLKTLKTKMHSLAFPVQSNSISNPKLATDGIAQPIKLEVDLSDIYPSQVACYYGGESLEITWEDSVFTIQQNKPYPTGRSRVNCTAPSKTMAKRYYWFSQPFFVPTAAGDWPD